MSGIPTPLAPAEALEPDHAPEAGLPETHGTPDELHWLATAAAKIVNRAIDGQPVGERLEKLVDEYLYNGEDEQLISEAAGVVALVGLYHVKKHGLSPRRVLEATPGLIIAVAHDPVGSEDFAGRLSDATENFCVGTTGIAEPEEIVPEPIPTNTETTTETRYPRRSEINSLARRAKQDDAHATNQLMTQLNRWTRAIAVTNRYFVPGGDWDDLCQEAMMSAMRALNLYDPARGNFAPLAETAIRRGLWTAIKVANRQKHGPLNHARSLHSKVSQADDGGERTLMDILPGGHSDPETTLIDQERFAALPKALERLSQLERTAMLMRLDGCSYEEIAKAAGIKYKAVDNAIQRVRKKLADIQP